MFESFRRRLKVLWGITSKTQQSTSMTRHEGKTSRKVKPVTNAKPAASGYAFACRARHFACRAVSVVSSIVHNPCPLGTAIHRPHDPKLAQSWAVSVQIWHMSRRDYTYEIYITHADTRLVQNIRWCQEFRWGSGGSFSIVATATPASGRVLLEAKRHTAHWFSSTCGHHVDIVWTSCESRNKTEMVWSNYFRRSWVCHWVPRDTIAIGTDQSIFCSRGTTFFADSSVEVYQ